MSATMAESSHVAPLVELAERAGAAIMEVYDRGGAEVTEKEDRSPLTEADLASHRVLVAGLAEITPDVPVLSEEGAETHGAVRLGWRRFWLVDPLDGTKEFISRNGEFTVNVALVEEGRPLLGVVHAPALATTYTGVVGGEARLYRPDADAGGVPIQADADPEAPLEIVASRSHPSPDLQALLDRLGEHRLVRIGSSLKICLVAAGEAHLYPRLGPTMEWDVAAGDAVLRAAGGMLVDVEGEPLRYNKEDLLNPYFVAEGRYPIPWRRALAEAMGDAEEA